MRMSRVRLLPVAQTEKLIEKTIKWGRCPSGQREQTVNLPAYAFGGSNPSLPTHRECSSTVEPQPSKLVMSVRSRSLARVAYVAQSVEHFLGKEEVTGSNPVVGSPIEKIEK